METRGNGKTETRLPSPPDPVIPPYPEHMNNDDVFSDSEEVKGEAVEEQIIVGV